MHSNKGFPSLTKPKTLQTLLATFWKIWRKEIITYNQTSLEPQQIVHFAGTTKSVCFDLVKYTPKKYLIKIRNCG